MLHVSISGLSNNHHRAMMTNRTLGAKSLTMFMSLPSLGSIGRYVLDVNGGNCKKNYGIAARDGNASFKTVKSQNSVAGSSSFTDPHNSPRADFYKKAVEDARDKFAQEISFQSKDKDISLAKALLYIAAEDEAYLEFNREIDMSSYINERKDTVPLNEAKEWDSVETMPMSGKKINEWLLELDALAKEVEAELVTRNMGCDFIEVIGAVNKVLFDSKGFKRPVVVDLKCSYLHSALISKSASAILLSVIYIEVCRRLNFTILGARVGEEFLIWPQTENPEVSVTIPSLKCDPIHVDLQELFKATSGDGLFKVVNGNCVDDPKSKASDINSDLLLTLDIATNRDIIGIALANLIRFHWKRASRSSPGLMLTTPLRYLHKSEKFNADCGSNMVLLRPMDLRLAMMASERLIILQPHNWALRRDYGMMLYYNKDYKAAVQELCVCMAFAPEEESQVLKPFVEKLNLMKLELSWKSPEQKSQLTAT